MSPELVFSIASTLALGGWLLLVFLPRWSWTPRIAGMALPAALAAAYVVILTLQWAESSGDFQTLAGVAALFANPWLLLAGWIHYLAFDMLVGTWEVRDAASRGIPHWMVVPCLVLTFLFGPAGWLVYQAVRSYKIKPA
jgi:hypothetical protein